MPLLLSLHISAHHSRKAASSALFETVHDLQVVTSVLRDPTDQPISVIATPTHAIRIKHPSAAPTGIDWMRLSPEDLAEMPILAELKRMTASNA